MSSWMAVVILGRGVGEATMGIEFNQKQLGAVWRRLARADDPAIGRLWPAVAGCGLVAMGRGCWAGP